MHRLAFAVLRELAPGGFQSGEHLAKRFGTSRSAISLALKDVERDFGVRLFRVPRRGYSLVTSIELIDVTKTQAALDAAAAGLTLDVLEVSGSTNTLMQSRAQAGGASGSVLLAEHQTAGRGRLGRAWHSNLGGALTFSVLWRFERGAGQLSGLSPAVAVAVLRGLSACGMQGVQVKWPNDLVHAGRKLGGILIETHGDMLGPSAAVIGIGLNVRLPDELRDAIDQPVADLFSIAPDVSRNQVLIMVLIALAKVLREFAVAGLTPFRAEWETAHAYQGRAVRVSAAGAAAFDATVQGLAEDGGLIVRTRGGEAKLASAEISLRRHGND